MTTKSVYMFKETLTSTLKRNTWRGWGVGWVLNTQKPFLAQEVPVLQTIVSWDFSQINCHCMIPLTLSSLLGTCFGPLFKKREWPNTTSLLWCSLACFHMQSIKWALKQQILEQMLMSWPGSSSSPRLISSVDQPRYPLNPITFQFLGFSFLRRS